MGVVAQLLVVVKAFHPEVELQVLREDLLKHEEDTEASEDD